jgi:hypothetical protein
MAFKDMVASEVVLGEPVTVGEVTIRPQSQVISLRWPRGGWIWRRPTAILVERGDQVEHVPILDITRVALWGLLGYALLFLIVAILQSIQQRRR